MLLKLEYPQPHGLSHSSFNRAPACDFCLEALAQRKGTGQSQSRRQPRLLAVALHPLRPRGCPNLGDLGNLGHPIKQQTKFDCVNMF